MQASFFLINVSPFVLSLLHKQDRKLSNPRPFPLNVLAKRTPSFPLFVSLPPPATTIIASRGPITLCRRAASDKTVHKTADTLAAGDRNLSPSTRVHFSTVSASSFSLTAGTASFIAAVLPRFSTRLDSRGV